MFQFLRGIVFVAAVVTNCGFAFAQNLWLAKSRVDGCRAYLLTRTPAEFYFAAGVCSGIVEGLHYAGSGICLPPNVSNEQAVRVVVKFIDDRPERLNEDFRALAVEALKAAWPRKN
jgi:Rap1a immunity proteins